MKPESNDTNSVIYLEADEDITAAIDKLIKSSATKVQMVTTKRSALFQSVINLKLLQKAAKDAKKSVVLVTSDRVATNLAGRLGMPVASQVGEEARVPTSTAGARAVETDDEIDGGTIDKEEAKPTAAKSAPAAAKSTPAATTPPPSASGPSNVAPEVPVESGAATAASESAKPKGQRVPNVGKIQKRIMWASLAVVAIVGLFGLNYYLTKATVTLYAQATQGHASFTFTADPTASHSDNDSGVLSAQQLTLSKSLSATVQATGTKDQGAKAMGTMTVNNSYDSNPHLLVSGTRFTSPGGLVFRSTQDVTVPGASISHGQPVAGQATVPVQADANGDQYNLAPAKYTIPGLSSEEQASIYGQGAQMQGGLSKIAKIITQADIDKAQAAALDGDKAGSAKALADKAGKDQVALAATLQQKVTNSDSNPDVGAEGQTASLTVQVDYTELAVQKSALSDLAKAKEGAELGSQSEIYDDGVETMQFAVSGAAGSDGSQKLKADATTYTGTKIDIAALTKDVKGEKYGDAVLDASKVPGVDKVEVKISPSWATSMPHITKHIKVSVKVSDTSTGGQ